MYIAIPSWNTFGTELGIGSMYWYCSYIYACRRTLVCQPRTRVTLSPHMTAYCQMRVECIGPIKSAHGLRAIRSMMLAGSLAVALAELYSPELRVSSSGSRLVLVWQLPADIVCALQFYKDFDSCCIGQLTVAHCHLVCCIDFTIPTLSVELTAVHSTIRYRICYNKKLLVGQLIDQRNG